MGAGAVSGYDRPERVTSPEAAEREFRRLRIALGRAKVRGDERAADYLRGRLERLRAARDERGAW